MNEDLLQDKDVLKRIKKELDWYFKINVPGEVNEATVWEAHKVYIRGILMMVGSEKKKVSPDKRNPRIRTATQIIGSEGDLDKLTKKRRVEGMYRTGNA